MNKNSVRRPMIIVLVLLLVLFVATAVSAHSWVVKAVAYYDPDQVVGVAPDLNAPSGHYAHKLHTTSQAGSGIPRYYDEAELGTITIAKQSEPDAIESFTFSGDVGDFLLSGGESEVFTGLMPGFYTFTEGELTGWALENIDCDSENVTQLEDGVMNQLGVSGVITCTFHNRRVLAKAEAGGPYAGNEGAAIPLDASSTVNQANVEQYRWDCTNDGIIDTTSANPGDSACTYDDNDDYTVRLQTVDIFGQTSEDTALVTVNNVAPDVMAGPDQAAEVGQPVTFSGHFSDSGTADSHTIAWDFGDGETASGSLSSSHSYTTKGSFTARLTVMDDDGAGGFAELTVTVQETPPTLSDIELSTSEIDEGARFILSGAMKSAGADGPLTLQIDWGDGHSATHHFPAGSMCFSLAHTCSDDNPSMTASDAYTITLTLSDERGAFSTETAFIQVNNVPPTVRAGPDQTTFVGDSVEFAAAITDPGQQDTHTITWDFSDGSLPASGTIVTHTFAAPGVFMVVVTAEDDDGGVGQDTVKVIVDEFREIYFPLMIKR